MQSRSDVASNFLRDFSRGRKEVLVQLEQFSLYMYIFMFILFMFDLFDFSFLFVSVSLRGSQVPHCRNIGAHSSKYAGCVVTVTTARSQPKIAIPKKCKILNILLYQRTFTIFWQYSYSENVTFIVDQNRFYHIKPTKY